METVPLATLLFGLAGVFSAPFLKNVFDMRREKNYREMVGSMVWPAAFFVVATVGLAMETSMPIRVQNILLGIFGALLGGSLLVWSGYLVRDSWSVKAQVLTPSVEQPMSNKDNSITGMTIQGNHQGGAAAEVNVTGSANQAKPPVGLDINVVGAPGQSVTGLRVIQNGPGTGLKVTVGGDGPATGVRVTVGTPQQK
jgi:hypothetical protein